MVEDYNWIDDPEGRAARTSASDDWEAKSIVDGDWKCLFCGKGHKVGEEICPEYKAALSAQEKHKK